MFKRKLMATVIMVALAGCGSSDDKKNTSNSGQTATVGLNKSSIDIAEGNSGNTNFTVTIQASRNVDYPISIYYHTEDITGVADLDYVPASGVAVITKGTRSVDVTLSVIGNNIKQSDRTFTVVLDDIQADKMKITKGMLSTTIRIKDDDPIPAATFTNELMTVHEDSGTIDIPITLSNPSDKEISVKLGLTGLATKDVDFSLPEGTNVTFLPLQTSTIFPVKILADNLVEGTEDITITQLNVTNGNQGEISSTKVLIMGDLKLPDTGYTSFYNNGLFTANTPDSEHPYQDGMYGQDVDPTYNGNGHAGFVYDKIDMAGNRMAESREDQACVYDNHTGLTWEIKGELADYEAENLDKAEFAAMHWNSKRNRYLWHNTNIKTNGGEVGGTNANEFPNQSQVSLNCSFPSRNHPIYVNATKTGCTTSKYIEAYNKSATCGHKDWRLPSIQELNTIVNHEPSLPHLDDDYFRDMKEIDLPNMAYLSSTPSNDNSASVWCINTENRQVMLCNKQSYNFIRLVRGPKL